MFVTMAIYDRFGFDEEGYNKEGYNKWGFDRNGFNKLGFDIHGFDRNGINQITGRDKAGFDVDGYDTEGYDRDGFNAYGYDREGYDRTGYNRDGFDKDGYDRNGYDKAGYDKYGFDAKGFNVNGYDSEGYDKAGYNPLGYDREGYDRKGYNVKGLNRLGYDRDGYDAEGYDRWHLNRDGRDETGYDIYGYDETGFDLDGYDNRGFDRAGIHKDGFLKTDFDENGFHKYTGLNLEGYNRDGFNINGVDVDGFDKDGYDINGYDRDGYDRTGFDKDGWDADGFDEEGYNEAGYDKNGYDRDGFNKAGYDVNGFDIEGYNKQGIDRAGFDRQGNLRKPDQYDTSFHSFTVDDLIEGRELFHPTLGRLEILGFEHGSRGRQVVLEKANGDYLYSDPEKCVKTCTFIDPEKLSQQKESYDEEEDTKERLYFRETEQIIRELDVREAQKARIKNIASESMAYREVEYIDRDGIVVRERRPVYHQEHVDTHFIRKTSGYGGSPYFCHIDYKDDEKLYIGKKELPGRIVDWADKRASLYYQFQLYIGNSSVGLRLVRDIDINKRLYVGYRDKYNLHAKNTNGIGAVNDALLSRILRENRMDKRIHDIIRSIQANQYNIISQDINQNMLVLGCAGSGKTMILLHRIRFLKYNNSALNLEDVMILSPTNILARESRELSGILEISKAKQYETWDLYKSLIVIILDQYGIVHDNLRNWKRLVKDKMDYYGQSKLDELYAAVSAITKDLDGCRAAFADNEQRNIAVLVQKIIDQFPSKTEFEKTLAGYAATVENEGEKYKKADAEAFLQVCMEMRSREQQMKEDMIVLNTLLNNHCYTHETRDQEAKAAEQKPIIYYTKQLFALAGIEDELLDETDGCDRTRLLQKISMRIKKPFDHELIKKVQKEWEALYRDDLQKELEKDKRFQRNTQDLDYKIAILESLLKSNRFFKGGSYKRNIKEGDVSRDFDKLCKVYKSFEWHAGDEIDPIDLIYQYNELMDKRSRLLVFMAGSNQNYLYDLLIRKVISDNALSGQNLKVSQGQLFAFLYLLQKVLGAKDIKKRYIFVDEFQDYAPAEIEFLKRYYPKSKFNFFGDYNQCINTKGLNDHQKSLFDFNGHKAENYMIMENYRNPVEVTKYVNDRFKMKMLAVGIHGIVMEDNKIHLKPLAKRDRAAIIVSDTKNIEDYVKWLRTQSKKYRFSNFRETGLIIRDTYNVIPISMTKGLEFERVIVVSKNLTENQLYVACTRAIRELQVIKS